MNELPPPERPGMTKGYGISTSPDGLMSWEDVEARLTEARNYWVASTRDDGRPHVAPVWGLWQNGVFLFSSDPDAVKARNLALRPEAVVHLESGDDVVIIEGKISGFDGSSPEFPGFAEAYDKKYGIKLEPGPGFACFKLVPGTAMAWLEADFPNTATRWRFRD